jgi:peptidoglycan/xylan/chitin deacetylase (PgdA/CDA1 family)
MNFLTVDFEEWFHITGAPKKAIETRPRPDEKRAARYTRHLLEIFRRQGVKATFFILGCVAEENSKLIKQIHEEGHEIASHGYSHRVLMELTPQELREELASGPQVFP